MAEFRNSMKRTRLLLLREVTWPLRPLCGLHDDTYIAAMYVDMCPRFYLIAPDNGGASAAVSNEKTYRIAADAVVVDERESLCLDPLVLDADGDGSPEVFIQLLARTVSRDYTSFVFFSRSAGAWRAYGSPAIGNDGELAQEVWLSGKKRLLDTMESGGWQIIDRPDGTKSFLAWMQWMGTGYGGGPHPIELQMFRFTPAGFVRDSAWNGGKSFVWTGGNTFALGDPMYSADKEMMTRWVEKGYSGTLTSEDSLSKSRVVGP